MFDAGDDPSAYLKSLSSGGSHDEAMGANAAQKSAAAGHWTWDDLVDRYVNTYLSAEEELEDGTKVPAKQAAIRDAKRYLGLLDGQPGRKGIPWFTGGHAHLRGKLLTVIDESDLEDMREKCGEVNSKSCSRKSVVYARAAYEWALANHAGKSGLSRIRPYWRMVSSQYKPRRRARSVTVSDLAKVLYVSETWWNRPLPGRSIRKPGADEITVAATWWLAFTAQRRGASMQILKSHIYDLPNEPGWKVVAFPAENMKFGRFHLLPVPPLIVERVIDRALRSGRPDSKWLFPATRERLAGQEETQDLAMGADTVFQWLRRLRAMDPYSKEMIAAEAKRQKKPKEKLAPEDIPVRNLLEGVPYFSPHDLRRAFVSEVGEKTSRADATSAVLDHSTKLADNAPFEDAAAVTRKFYDMSQRLSLKSEAIQIWAETLIAHYDEIFSENYGKPKKLRVPRNSSSPPLRAPTAGQKAKQKRNAEWYARREAEKTTRTPKVLDFKRLKLAADAEGDHPLRPDEW
ncbi:MULTISPECIES: hypothetical protein [Aurantimonas]|uniref:hypothetical protein n=1 Tax=Aurantimonas TaxID=182269 RepID=UPI00351695BF